MPRRKSRTHLEVLEVLGQNRISPMSGVSPRDSDQELIIQIIQLVYDARLDARQLGIIRSMNFESITRARRKLQEGGEYLPSPEVGRARRLKGYEITQTAPKESAAGIQHRIERNIS